MTRREYCSQCDHYEISKSWCYLKHQSLKYGKKNCNDFKKRRILVEKRRRKEPEYYGATEGTGMTTGMARTGAGCYGGRRGGRS